MRPSAFIVIVGLLLGSAPASAQVKALFDVRVPMRDGVELSADIWLPADGDRFPTILTRTPYLKTGPGANARFWVERGYAFMTQDVRGRGDSEGLFDFWHADIDDGYDTIEWIARQPWSDGNVGMVGGSYTGVNQWMAARNNPPHLRCITPNLTAARFVHELPYQGGAWRMNWGLTWINSVSGHLSQPVGQEAINWDTSSWNKIFQHRPLLTMDSVMGRPMRLWRMFLENPTFNGYWRQIQWGPEEFSRLAIPTLTFTGWFDGTQPGSIHYWAEMRRHSPAKDRQHLVIGPWNHRNASAGGRGQLRQGEMEFGANSSIRGDSIRAAFFEDCLKGGEKFEFPAARIYVTGSNRWLELDHYPPPEVQLRPLYLHSGGRANTAAGNGTLSWSPPGNQPPDRFTFDPQHPVPSLASEEAVDYQEIERRSDVLVYTSEVLSEPVEIIGPVTLVLYAATDGRDTDFVARILDVYPGGKSVRLGPKIGGILRARFRNSYEREELLTPGKVEEYRIDLWDIAHTFLPGHQIRIQVTSSAYPWVNPNQNTGNPIATDTEWRTAQQTIYHDHARRSHVLLPVMPKSADTP